MGQKTKSKSIPASIVWFEIPADKPERAKKFYSALFGWKIKAFPAMKGYWHIDTGGDNASPDGGLYKRKLKNQPITNYVHVASLTKSLAKVQKLGGKIVAPRTDVPGMGCFAICLDLEGNIFALWERAPK